MVYVWSLIFSLYNSFRLTLVIGLALSCTGFSVNSDSGVVILAQSLTAIFLGVGISLWIKKIISERVMDSYDNFECQFYLGHPILRAWNYLFASNEEAFRIALITDQKFEASTFYRNGIDRNQKIKGLLPEEWARKFSSWKTWNYIEGCK